MKIFFRCIPVVVVGLALLIKPFSAYAVVPTYDAAAVSHLIAQGKQLVELLSTTTKSLRQAETAVNLIKGNQGVAQKLLGISELAQLAPSILGNGDTINNMLVAGGDAAKLAQTALSLISSIQTIQAQVCKKSPQNCQKIKDDSAKIAQSLITYNAALGNVAATAKKIKEASASVSSASDPTSSREANGAVGVMSLSLQAQLNQLVAQMGKDRADQAASEQQGKLKVQSSGQVDQQPVTKY